MEKREGKFNLLEAIMFLEATTSKGFPDDGTGIATDDDYPPGNIVYGEKYKKDTYFNKLTGYNKTWKVDLGDWTWAEFEKSAGMEDIDNYSNTLHSMEDLFPEETWNNVWRRMKQVPARTTNLRFKKAMQPWRKSGKGQIGPDRQDHVEVDVKKDDEVIGGDVTDKSFKGAIKIKSVDTFTPNTTGRPKIKVNAPTVNIKVKDNPSLGKNQNESLLKRIDDFTL